MLDHDEVVRLYGPWRARTPADAAVLLEEYPGPWWVAGGWAVEALTGPRRTHGDLDLGVPRSDVEALRQFLRGRLDVWAAEDGTLRPLTAPVAPGDLRTCDNLWLRHDGASPWEYDVLLTDVTDGRWRYKRDQRVQLPLASIWELHDGVRVLRPEIQLLHKAPGRRPRDEADLEAALPLLDDRRRSWLRAALDTAHPCHPWIALL